MTKIRMALQNNGLKCLDNENEKKGFFQRLTELDSTFVTCSLGLTGFDSKMRGYVSTSRVEVHLANPNFTIVTGETSYALAA